MWHPVVATLPGLALSITVHAVSVAAAAPVAVAPAPASVTDAAITAPALTDSLRLDPAVRTGVLTNGLRWFIRPNHRPESRVALRLVVAAGSTAEADDQRGFAHFCEHMNFNGSAHFKPEELVEYLQSIGLRFGADANAYTSFDETVYMLEVPTDRDTLLDRGVMALSDFAGRATLSDAEIEKERGVVLEEWRLGRGAGERQQRVLLPALYHGACYAQRLPIGVPEVITKGSADRLRAFYRDWYTPEHMAVIAVGDIDPERMESLIREHFGDLGRPARALPRARCDIPRHDSTLVAIATDKEATSSGVSIVYKHPRQPDATVADYRRSTIDYLFAAMFNTRLDEIAHRSAPPFLRAGVGPGQLGRSLDTFRMSAGVRDGGIEAGLTALLGEAARVRQHGFLEGELKRAKQEIIAQTERAFAERDKSESGNFADEYVRFVLDGEPAPGIAVEHALTLALMGGITLAEVDARAAAFVHDDCRVVMVTAPEKEGASVPGPATLRAALSATALTATAGWEDRTAGRALMTRPPTPGTVTARRRIDEIGVTVLTLSNGVEVWLKPTDFKADEIVFSSYALGGYSVADSTAFATTWLTPMALSDAGVGGFTGVELRKLLAGRIANASASFGLYTHGVGGGTRPTDLETALQLVYLTFTQPTADTAGFAALKQRVLAMLEDRANNPEAVFADTVSTVNTGGWYISRTPKPAEIDAVRLEDVLAFQRARFANAADFTFTFAGTFDVDSIAPLLARYLGALPSRGRPTSAFVRTGPRYPHGTRAVQVHRGIEPKSSTRLTFFSGTALEELDLHRARAAGSILTDHLRQSLRELLGGTYSAGASFNYLSPLPGYATMTVTFGCDPARLDTMVATTMAEIRRLRDEGPTADDVKRDQEIERRELEVAMRSNGFWTGSIMSTLQLGIDPRRIARRRERIDLLTPENLRETFRRYFPIDRWTAISLMPALEATDK